MRLILNPRKLWREFLRWRTVVLLDGIDADVHALKVLRDIDIPVLLRAAEREKLALLRQAHALMDDEERTQFETVIKPITLPAGWSPSKDLPPGPLFSTTRRNHE